MASIVEGPRRSEAHVLHARCMPPRSFSKGSSENDMIRNAYAGTVARSKTMNLPTLVTPAPELRGSFLDRLVIPKDHTVQLAWTAVLVVLLVYVATVVLYRFAFCEFHIKPDGIVPIEDNTVGWTLVEWVVDVLFWCDLFANFFFAYEDSSGREVKSLCRISKRYMQCMFWVNLLACLPEGVAKHVIELLSPDNDGNQFSDFGIARLSRLSRLQRISKLARLARLTRLIKLVDLASQGSLCQEFKRLRGVRIVNFMLVLVWACHLLACGWYLTAALHSDVASTWVGRRMVMVDGQEQSLLDRGPFEQWLVAMYFVLTVFTTVGFGDISAGTEAEIVYAVFTMIVGAVIHSITISEVIQVVVSTDKHQEIIDDTLALVNTFSKHTDLDSSVVNEMNLEVVGQMKAWKQSKAQAPDKERLKSLFLSNTIPGPLLGNISVSLYQGKLCQNAFLKVCAAVSSLPPRLPSLLAIHLSQECYEPEETVFQMQDFALHLFLVLSGTFAFVGKPSLNGGKDSMVSDWVEVAKQRTPPAASVSSPVTSLPSSNAIANAIASGTIASWSRTPSPSGAVKEAKLWPYKLIGHSNFFGEFECVSGTAREATVRCEQAATSGTGVVLVLHKRDFFQLVEEFPQFGNFWAAAFWRRNLRRAHALKRLQARMSYRHLAAVIIQRAWKSVQKGTANSARMLSRAHSLQALWAPSVAKLMDKDKNSEPTTSKAMMQMSIQGPGISQVSRQVQELYHIVGDLRDEVRMLRSHGKIDDSHSAFV